MKTKMTVKTLTSIISNIKSNNKFNFDNIWNLYRVKGKDIKSFLLNCKDIIVNEVGIDKYNMYLDEYCKFAKIDNIVKVESEQSLDQAFEDRSKGSILRDGDKISKYHYKIFVKNNPALEGYLTREDMEHIYSSYSYNGRNESAKTTSEKFDNLTLAEFKKVLKAFNINKNVEPFAPHVVEERTEEQLIELQNNFKVRKVERQCIKDESKFQEKRIKDLTEDNFKLSKKIQEYKDNINLLLEDSGIVFKGNKKAKSNLESDDKILMINLADFHIGCMNDLDSLYGNAFDESEVWNRIEVVKDFILSKSTTFNSIVINILGDMIDGADNMTARTGHVLPQNMDTKAQIKTYSEVIIYLIDSIKSSFDDITLNMVECGNHGGHVEWVANNMIKYKLETMFDDINIKVADNFFLDFSINGKTYIICHGKDGKNMNRNYPIALTGEIERRILDICIERELKASNGVVFIKGDLHQFGVNRGNRVDYINVPSMMGSSTHSQINYGNQKPSVCYMEVTGLEYSIGCIDLV